MNEPKYSIVIPVYKNELSVTPLLESLEQNLSKLLGKAEVIFVDDGSPDDSVGKILTFKDVCCFKIRVIQHSRNFGAFAAVRTGINASQGEYVAVISADLQEPTSVVMDFFAALESGKSDIVFGMRADRSDPKISSIFSKTYWALYRRFINSKVPKGGVDVFAFTKQVGNVIRGLKESNTSLVAILFWIGFKYEFVSYIRVARVHGKSSWTFSKKMRYLSDSIFSFSDLPIKIIRALGVMGILVSVFYGSYLVIASLNGSIIVRGYVPLMLGLTLGTSLILLALSIVGSYLWRTFENSQARPYAIVRSEIER